MTEISSDMFIKHGAASKQWLKDVVAVYGPAVVSPNLLELLEMKEPDPGSPPPINSNVIHVDFSRTGEA